MSVSVSVFSKKALLVINPVAGRKMIQRNICDVVRCLMDQGYLVTTAVTSRRGEARELSYSFGRDFDLLVCAGGDGTLNECISGMAEAQTERYTARVKEVLQKNADALSQEADEAISV